MITILEKAIIGMALLRFLSGSIEIFTAFLMMRFNEIEKALIINSTLSLIGPFILVVTTAIGLFKISLEKLAWVTLGVIFILYGIKSN